MADFTYMSLGGGVQSGTMAEMIAVGELPAPDLVVFADTKDEPSYVYDYVSYLRRRLSDIGVEVVTVSAGNLVERLMAEDGRFAAIPVFTIQNGEAGRLKRQCTADYKIAPIETEVRRHLFNRGLAKTNKRGNILVKRGVTVEAWLGISLDEVARMKPNRKAWITNQWPLINLRMSRNDCVQWLIRHKLPVPRKSSCRVCPFHNNDYWRMLRDDFQEDWNDVVDFDKSLRDSRASRFVATAKGDLYLHSSCVPLENVDLRTPEEKGQLRLFETDTDVCDEGYCFI